MARTYRIAVIPGDGIGKETVPKSLKVLDVATRRFGFHLEFAHYDWSCDRYKKTGAMMPADGMERLAESDSIVLGAIGWPDVPDHISLWGLLIPIRRGFDQYVNLRPCKLMSGRAHPACRAHRGGYRLLRGAREHRGRVFLGGRADVPGHRAGVCLAAERVHPPRRRSCAALRLRAGAKPPETAPDLGHQVERHHHHHAIMGRTLRGDGASVSGGAHRPVSYRHPVRAFRAASGLVRRGGGVEPVRRHTERSRPGGRRIDRHRAVRQHQPRAGPPVDVRTGARLGAGHCRAGNLQPDRPDLVGRR